LAAIIAAFAAFFVWIELLMRDAAVYVVALFMPMALAASIWPRWSGALRRTSELLFVVIASKFVIVSIISLAAGLAANNSGQVEHILAAAALMLLACFAPFVLFRLVPFAEGAVAGAYSRRTAGAGAMSAAQSVSPAQIMRRTARSNWNEGGSGAGGSGPSSGGGPGSGPSRGLGGSGGIGSGGGGAAVGAEGAAAGSAGSATAMALPIAAAKGSQAAAQRLATSGISEEAGEVAASVLEPWRARVEFVALGGDRKAIDEVLKASPQLGWLADKALPRFFDVPDPRQRVLERLPYELYAAELTATAAPG